MDLWRKQKKIAAAFGAFLGFMLLCTLISRAVYASGLPQVAAEYPSRMAITHKVEAEGVVQQGMEYAVHALGGLRCRAVYAHVGDQVTPETLLFEVDLEDLQEQIAEQELAIRKLSLTIRDQEENAGRSAEQEKTQEERAREDYDRTRERTQGAVDQAKEDLAAARKTLEDLQNHPVKVTPEAERRKALEEYEAWESGEGILWAQREQELKKILEETKGDPGKSEEEKAAAEQAYAEHLAKKKKKPDYSSEDSARQEWEKQAADLKSRIDAGEQSLSEARKNRDDALLEAKRNVADAGIPSAADSSLEINRLELSVLKEKLEHYKEIREKEGRVYPESGGVITRIAVSPGERIPDGASMVYADLDSPFWFHTTLSKEQKKYVNQGDTAKLALGKKVREVSVDYVAESESNPELFEVTVALPKGQGTLGQSGVFSVQTQSEIYSFCIPLSALYTDTNGRNYVYLIREKSGILGKELAAEQVYVRVLDKNDRYAALEEDGIGSERKVIVDADQLLEDGKIVRYKE